MLKLPRLTALLIVFGSAALAPLAPLHAQTPAAPPAAAPVVAAPQAEPEPALQWHDVTKWGVEGRAWTDMEREGWFDRLPKAANGKVT